MNPMRKSIVWTVMLCSVAASSARGQTDWRQLAVPLEPASGLGVSLGQPRALGSSGMIQQASHAAPRPRVIRALGPRLDDEPRTLPLPKTGAASQTVEKIGKPNEIIDDGVIILDEEYLGDPLERGWSNGYFPGVPAFYASAEWLYWTARGYRLPPLVTTASPFDNPFTRGALGFGNTQLLYGGNDILGGGRSGARFTVGHNLDSCGIWGLEGTFFFLARQSEIASFNSDAFPVIGRPFFNINTGQQDRELLTTPEFNRGGLQTLASTTLWGAEVNLRPLLWCGCNFDITGLVGFRYLDLRDRLRIEEASVFINDVPGAPGAPPVVSRGDQVFVFDRFDTHNRFYGGQIGVAGEWRDGPWFLAATAKLGLGVTHQTIDIDGGQRITRANGNVEEFRGGLLALQSNIGHHTRSNFSVVPEVGIKLGYQVTDNLRVYAGYDFLYWSNVVRPGDQIDLALDANTIPNAGAMFPRANQARPIVPFQTTGFWAHGVNAGLEIRY